MTVLHADAGIGQLARARFRIVDELLQRVDRHIAFHAQDGGGRRETEEERKKKKKKKKKKKEDQSGVR